LPYLTLLALLLNPLLVGACRSFLLVPLVLLVLLAILLAVLAHCCSPLLGHGDAEA
jgi:hypothetical protein